MLRQISQTIATLILLSIRINVKRKDHLTLIQIWNRMGHADTECCDALLLRQGMTANDCADANDSVLRWDHIGCNDIVRRDAMHCDDVPRCTLHILFQGFFIQRCNPFFLPYTLSSHSFGSVPFLMNSSALGDSSGNASCIVAIFPCSYAQSRLSNSSCSQSFSSMVRVIPDSTEVRETRAGTVGHRCWSMSLVDRLTPKKPMRHPPTIDIRMLYGDGSS